MRARISERIQQELPHLGIYEGHQSNAGGQCAAAPTFFGHNKAFNSVETEDIFEALDTQYLELHDKFTIKISLYDTIVNAKRGPQHVNTISPKLIRATLENTKRALEWKDME